MTPVPAYSSLTIASYETDAEHYDTLVGTVPSAAVEAVDRADTGRVLRKIASALRPGGGYLISVRQGTGELTDDGYHMTYWQRDEFVASLAAAGLTVEWEYLHTDGDDHTWLTFLGTAA
jgi:hypothetical protein